MLVSISRKIPFKNGIPNHVFRRWKGCKRADFAELVGVHRVSVGRLLQRMQNESLLEIRRGRLRLRSAFFSDKDLRCWHDLAAPAGSEKNT